MNYTTKITIDATTAQDLLKATLTEADEELYNRCVAFVTTARKASATMLQRQFRIGYAKASRMIDIMEERGIVAPQTGANSAREVLVLACEQPEDADGVIVREEEEGAPEENGEDDTEKEAEEIETIEVDLGATAEDEKEYRSVEAPGDRFIPLLDGKEDGKLLRALDGAVHAIAQQMKESAGESSYCDITGSLTLKLDFELRGGEELSVEASFSKPTVSRKLPFKASTLGIYNVDEHGNIKPYDDGQGRLDFGDDMQAESGDPDDDDSEQPDNAETEEDEEAEDQDESAPLDGEYGEPLLVPMASGEAESAEDGEQEANN